jgi:DNA-binding transcriptional MerR regulator
MSSEKLVIDQAAEAPGRTIAANCWPEKERMTSTPTAPDAASAGSAIDPVMPEAGFSGTKAAKIVGISYRQLDYWARTGLVRPSLADAKGSGSRREYSYRDLLELRVIKSLLDAGIKLESVRVAFEYLREHVDTDIAAAHLVISGNDVVLCDGDELIDVMRRGQGVLNILPIGGVKENLDAALAPEQPAVSAPASVAL